MLPQIETKLEFGKVLWQMFGAYVNMSPPDRQLQPRPKALDPINVAISVNILASPMVHRFMLKTGLGQPAIGLQFIAVHRATLFDVPFVG